MGIVTAIQWCHHTFNGWIGCTKVSAGCANCYAESLMDKRWGKVQWGKGNPRQRTSLSNWKQPLKWDRDAKAAGERRRVFCSSLADVFDEEVPRKWREDLAMLIELTPNLDWLLLTKRPENIHRLWPGKTTNWPNIWYGTSAENQETYDERLPHLLQVAARVRFISYEPALGPINFECFGSTGCPTDWSDGIHWVIVGGESGPYSREFRVEWATETINQCRDAKVACFVKQVGAKPVHDWYTPYERLVDRKGGDWNEWPESLRVREFPLPQKGKP